MECDTFFHSVLWHCCKDDRNGMPPVKSWVLACWRWQCDWSLACHTAPTVTTTSIILAAVQNGDILVLTCPDCPGRWPLNECCCHRHLLLVMYPASSASARVKTCTSGKLQWLCCLLATRTRSWAWTWTWAWAWTHSRANDAASKQHAKLLSASTRIFTILFCFWQWTIYRCESDNIWCEPGAVGGDESWRWQGILAVTL